MSDSILSLMFEADSKELEEANEKLVSLSSHIPSVGEAIEGLAKSFAGMLGPVGLAVAAVGGLAVAGAELAEKTMEQIESLEKLSAQTGVNVGTLQEMNVAMALSGQSTDGLGSMFNKLNKNISAAQDPASKASVAMKMLGISMEELKSGDSAEIMTHVAKSLSAMAPGANKAALEMAVFGKSGAEADAILKSLVENGDRAKQMLIDHGAVTEQDIETQKAFGGAMEEAKLVFQGMGLAIAREVTPAITTVVSWFDNATKIGGTFATSITRLWNETLALGHELWNLSSPFRDLISQMFKVTQQFTEGAGKSQAFKDILSGLGTAFTITTSLIRPFVTVVYGAFEILHTFLQTALATNSAMGDLAHGNLKAAGQEFVNLSNEIKTNIKNWKDFKQEQEDADAGLNEIVVTAQKISPPLEEATRKVGSVDAAFNAMQAQNKVDALNQKLAAQITIMDAAAKGLDAYKAAQDEVAIATEKAALKNARATETQIRAAETAMRAANAAKQATTDEVAGWTAINALVTHQNQLLSKNTELEKAKQQIHDHRGMTEAEQQELLEKAKLVDATKQQIEVDKLLEASKASVVKNIDAEKMAMTLTSRELKLYNEEAKLTAQFNKDAFDKTPEQVAKLKLALTQNIQALKDNNTETLQWTQSMAGFNAGAQQAFGNFAEGALNANKLGSQFVTQGLNGMATALSEIGTKGGQAFRDLALSMAKMIEEAVAKIAIVAGIAASVSAIWGTAAGDAVWELAGGKPKGFAKGGAFAGGGEVTAFANGGVVGSPTMAPMALFGEAGPEAIMPLQRNSQGQLGVMMTGGASGGGTVVHNHLNQVTINSNQDPHQIAREAKKQMDRGAKLADARIANAQRPAGQLNRMNHAFN